MAKQRRGVDPGGQKAETRSVKTGQKSVNGLRSLISALHIARFIIPPALAA